MKIVDLRVMRGPNYWSVKHPKIIVLKLDLEEQSDVLTNQLPEFYNRLRKMFPGMQSHRSSEGVEGGFFKTVEEGTTLGHVVQHVALELQTMAGMDSGFGRCYPTRNPHEVYVIFSYQEERAGEYAAYAAVRITEALIKKAKYKLWDDLERLHEIREDEYFGPSTYAIVSEAVSRGIPYIRLDRHSLIQLGYGKYQKRIQATLTCRTACFAVEIAGDKNATKDMLSDAGIPVPKGTTVYSQEELRRAITWLGFPLVIKPLDGNHGKGATINITNLNDAKKGFIEARKYSQAVMVEQYITGFDFRLLVINGKFVAAAKRTPAMVIGDGVSTIKQLIDKENKDPRRGIGHEKVLTRIKVDKHTQALLKSHELTTQSVVPAGYEVFLKSTANISTGGTATDVTDLVDPYNILMAERIAGIVGLDICGIDVMTTDIAIPLNEARGAVLEVNAAPGFRMHISPTYGLPRNVAEPVIDMLFPRGQPASIPIIAVTGTNGKTTTTRLIAHMVKHKGYQVGYTTTDGIYIQDKLLEKGDTTGSYSAEFVLKDPTVNFAVLECARGGLLRSGLGFQQCDIGIVTNVSSDHLGLRDIHTLEELAQVKAVIPKSVSPDGYAVLNADDDLVYAMADGLTCNVAFFSMDENNPRILKHIAKGGLAAVFENGYISIFKNSYKLRVDRVGDVPLTFGGRARFNIENILAATLAGYISHFDIEDIKTSLRTFIPSPAKTPGRMNLFKFPNFEVLVDYAHNVGGLKAIGQFIESLEVRHKVGIIAGVGDRRTEDFYELGQAAGNIFDEVIIRLDNDLRGKTAEEITQPLIQGIEDTNANVKIELIPEEMRAIAYALERAEPGSFIAIFTEDISESVKMVEHFKVIQDRKMLVD
ncbi:cyanophycin synthetase [Pontibacter sp. BT310]|uniref:Cyanophycin synthetase n=1 Tax=Pontibacter populi TaxID=890055 RepID=A0ABS6XC91_9BACT|nr:MULTISPECIES: cyanophycin synthetase [Pontibacter]MBJ6118405.1 cyanophycin synthetase [Pontibacter sp. BT310]MBR0570833.1 cyanophycin synthetase [Microvirga sp. STS03]MBW3365259.1 cyanophycin synthetase [Pontibacter populi]